jgi:hypothetical protein
MTDALEALLARMPSPIEQGRTDFEQVMEHGTDRQKEALLIVLRVLARIKPSRKKHTRQLVTHAIGAFSRAMSC